MATTLFVRNDNLIRLRGVVNALTGDPVGDMEGTVTLLDPAGVPMVGADALDLQYASTATTPFYYAIVPDDVQLTDGAEYPGVIQSTNYGVRIDDIVFTARKRKG